MSVKLLNGLCEREFGFQRIQLCQLDEVLRVIELEYSTSTFSFWFSKSENRPQCFTTLGGNNSNSTEKQQITSQ